MRPEMTANGSLSAEAESETPQQLVTTADMLYVKRNTVGAVPSRAELFDRDMNFLDASIVRIRDVRQSEVTFSLETTGFQYERMSVLPDIHYTDESSVKDRYLPALEQFVAQQLGASSVKAFHHKVRDQTPGGLYSLEQSGPATRPHVDVTSTFAPILFSWIQPELYRDVVENKKHWHMLNAWRPLKTVQRDPLALAEATSVSSDDYLTILQPERGPDVNSWFLQKRSGHRWWYMSEQTPEDLLLFLQYDSKGGPVVPHSSVSLPTSIDEARESIEVRMVVVY